MTIPCDSCDAPCAAVCAPAVAVGHDALTPGALVRLAQAGPHALLDHCTSCGSCEQVCPYGVAVRTTLQSGRPSVAATAWLATPPPVASTVVVSSCPVHHGGWDAQVLQRALARVAPGVHVLPALPCGGDSGPPRPALAAAIAAATAGCHTLVVPTGACRDAIDAHLQAAGRRGALVAVFDQWLARFGVPLPRGAQRFSCCRLRRAPESSGVGATHAADLTCCGAGEPLASAFPSGARATAIALLRQWQAAGLSDVVVEDAACYRHLDGVAGSAGIPMRLHNRAAAFLVQAERAVALPDDDRP